VTASTNAEYGPAEGQLEVERSAGSPETALADRSVPERYYFNLTNGDVMIRDDEGIRAASLRNAVIAAMEAIEELRAHDPFSDEWQGWRLEIVYASGQAVLAIPLDALSHH
jgi:hypothetical protein